MTTELAGGYCSRCAGQCRCGAMERVLEQIDRAFGKKTPEKLACQKCGKRLSRKTARLIGGVIMCSTCMFAPRKSGVTRQGRDAAGGSGSGEAASSTRSRTE